MKRQQFSRILTLVCPEKLCDECKEFIGRNSDACPEHGKKPYLFIFSRLFKQQMIGRVRQTGILTLKQKSFYFFLLHKAIEISNSKKQ